MIDWLLGGELGAEGQVVLTAPDWMIFVGVAVALVAWVAAVRGARSVPARVAELGFWALALLGLVAAIARPVWEEEEGRQESGRLAVLVDGSRSMAVLEDGTARSAAVDAILDHVDADDVDLYHFGHDLAVGPPELYDDGGTDLEGALDALGERVAGERLAGVVLVTDGLDRGLLRKRFAKEEDALPPELSGPLTVFQVGATDGLRDLSVRFVDAGGYAYVHSPFRIFAEVQGVGYEGRTVPVELFRDEGLVSSRRVTIGEDGLGQAEFEVIPDRAGRFTYTVKVPDYEDDAVRSNNVMPIVVRVVRDRIRVMQVAGAPSWDVKFLRRFLKGDPSVDLVSFFILRTHDDRMRRYDNSELSLIQFPYEDLFDRELPGFDLVVFHNFDYRPYFQGRSAASELLQNLESFVRDDGHAFVMVGGDRSFSLGEYGGTPLAEILPVQVSPTPVEADEQGFQPVLTEAGRRHPVTRLTAEPDENVQWWERLHTLDGTNVTLGPAPGASVLLEHPRRRTGSGSPLPVLAVREVGAGRTMALTVDTSWRWSLSEAAEGRGNQAYLRFWKGAIRWLIGDATTARVSAETSRENYRLGDEVRLVVGARDSGFAPMRDARVVAEVAAERREPERYEGVTDGDGEVVLRFSPESRGAHRAIVRVYDGDSLVDTVSTVFAVTTRDPELDDVVPDAAFLRWLADATDGRYYAAGELGPVLRDPEAGRVVFDRRETPLWRAPLLGGWIGLFAGLAWIVRRRSGLR